MKEKKLLGISNRVIWNLNDLNIPLHIAEAYRIIRTNFAFGSIDRSLKVFQVTSSVKSEGKTTTVVNLGISFSQTGKKVLLIDADMRRPSLHRVLRLDGMEQGLSDIISKGYHWDTLIEPTRIQNLFVIPAGSIPSNPAELLSSKRFEQVLEEVKTQFDLILIDSPPMISVADAPIIASRVDGTLLIVRSGFIPRHLCAQAKKAICNVQGNIVGCILNGVLSQHHPYYYYRYHHDYYSDDMGTKTMPHKGRSSNEKLSVFEKIKLSLLPMFPAQSENKKLVQPASFEESRLPES